MADTLEEMALICINSLYIQYYRSRNPKKRKIHNYKRARVNGIFNGSTYILQPQRSLLVKPGVLTYYMDTKQWRPS